MPSPRVTALQPTYRKADSDVWVLNFEDIPVPRELVNDRQLVHLAPGSIGGNHTHPRTEWFVAIGKNITFYWLDEAGQLYHKEMAPQGEILLFEVPPFLPHAIKNDSEQSGVLMEFGSDKMKDVERVIGHSIYVDARYNLAESDEVRQDTAMSQSSSQAKHFRELVQYIQELEDSKQLSKFLKAILTPKELEEIPTRLQIVKLLKRGLPQREIADKLGVGIATVTRGSKELHAGNFKDIA